MNTPLQRGGGIPLYAQISEALMQRILRGEWLPGANLPAEPDLCEEFGVARGTLTRHKAGFALVVIALMMGVSVSLSAAQGNEPTLAQTAEYDIGFDCPAAAVLDPAGTTFWVLMNNCFSYGYSLHAYNVADGTPLVVDDWAESLAILDEIYIDRFITPLAFTPAGDLSLWYSDPYTYESTNLIIPLASGGDIVTQTSASYNSLLAGVSPYPEFSVYSPDHTRVVATSETAFHIIDVQMEREIATIPVEGGLDGAAFASFADDGAHLYVITRLNPGSMDDDASNLLIYSLPDGALVEQYSLAYDPSWISPDGTKAAVELASNNIGDQNDLAVLDLKSGLISSTLTLLEDPKPVLNCLNGGRDVSDLGFRSDGYLALTSLQWLPDSSGLVVSLSYGGDSAGGDTSVCIFNYSRIRTYTVGSGG